MRLPRDHDYAAEYSDFRWIGPLCCWACGRYGPTERAHIVNKPRREDTRAVIKLCAICHKIQHGERLAGEERPRLLVEHMLWLKSRIDPSRYDRAWLQRHTVGRLPTARAVADWYLMQMMQNDELLALLQGG